MALVRLNNDFQIAAIAAALLMPIAAVAQTACMTASDLNLGITVTLDSGATEVYRRDADDGAVVIVDGTDESGPAYRLGLAQGILVQFFDVVDEGDRTNSVSTTYDYPVAPTDVPVPVPGMRWQVSAVRSDSKGETTEDQSLQAGAVVPLAIGGCIYDSLPVTVSYGTAYVEEITYLPDLGFGFLHWFQNEGGERNTLTLISLERAD